MRNVNICEIIGAIFVLPSTQSILITEFKQLWAWMGDLLGNPDAVALFYVKIEKIFDKLNHSDWLLEVT